MGTPEGPSSINEHELTTGTFHVLASSLSADNRLIHTLDAARTLVRAESMIGFRPLEIEFNRTADEYEIDLGRVVDMLEPMKTRRGLVFATARAIGVGKIVLHALLLVQGSGPWHWSLTYSVNLNNGRSVATDSLLTELTSADLEALTARDDIGPDLTLSTVRNTYDLLRDAREKRVQAISHLDEALAGLEFPNRVLC